MIFSAQAGRNFGGTKRDLLFQPFPEGHDLSTGLTRASTRAINGAFSCILVHFLASLHDRNAKQKSPVNR